MADIKEETDKIFQKYFVNIEKLIDYGFKKNQDIYSFEKIFIANFKAIIKIKPDDKKNSCFIEGHIYDIESKDEFLPIRIKNGTGTFIGEIKEAYIDLLKDIRDKCFIKKYFIFNQTNRISNLIIEKYKNYPEFLWEKFPNCAIFRNPDTKKWYFVILDVDRSKIQKDKSGLVEIALVKLDPDKITNLTKQKNFYSAYHMNKKYWMTIILDESVADDEIMDLISESHSFSKKK